ncbi:hypothetical protein [Rahnella inusitata]|uniref:hypothetical protein n=1 Tax=Rahnella inusitata TaxID=58169 RepID=UPI0039BE099E
MNNDLEQYAKNSFTDSELEFMAQGNNPVANAYRELLAFRRAAKQEPTGYLENGKDFMYEPRHKDLIKNPIPVYTTPQPAHTEQDGWVSIPKDMLADYRDVKNSEIQTYKASFGSHCDIPRSRWQRDLADLTEELAEIDKLIAAPKPESE